MHVHEKPHEGPDADFPAHSPATKATLWLVLLASLGVIVFVGLKFSDLQRDPELEFNLAKLEGEDHKARLEGLRVLELIAAERANGIAPRKIDRALPALIRSLGDPSSEIRIAATTVIRTIGPEAASATEALAANLGHEEVGVRVFAVMALATVAPDEPKTVAGAMGLARDPDPRVAMTGIAALAHLGERSRPAVDALVELASRSELKDAIAQALEAIDPAAAGRLR